MNIDLLPLGHHHVLYLEAGSLYDSTNLQIPVYLIKGSEPGPRVFITSTVHGDEILGIDVIRRLYRSKFLKSLRGSLILVPIANVYGFNNRSRYLPDRRDLNRSFPGFENGTLASRIAWEITHKVIQGCDFGIDLHTAAVHRSNLPQLRVDFRDKKALRFAESFGIPILLNAPYREGSLRQTAAELNVPVVTLEAGEALRAEPKFTRICLHAVLEALAGLKMIAPQKKRATGQIFKAKSSFWLRAPRAGLLEVRKPLGSRVSAGDRVAYVRDPMGDSRESIRAQESGIVVGLTQLPLVNRGDAVMHIATGKQLDQVFSDLDDYFDRFEVSLDHE